MFDDRGTYRSSPQTIAALPLEVDLVATADLLDFCFVLRLIRRLPGDAEAVAVVTNVKHLLLHKPFANWRRDATQHAARIRERCLAAAARRNYAMEIDPRWEREPIRILVMQYDALISRIVGRRVDVAG